MMRPLLAALTFLLPLRTMLAQTRWRFILAGQEQIFLYDSVRVQKLDTTRTYGVWQKLIDVNPKSNRWKRGVRYSLIRIDVRCSDLAMRQHESMDYDSLGNAISEIKDNSTAVFTATFPESIGESIAKAICADLGTTHRPARTIRDWDWKNLGQDDSAGFSVSYDSVRVKQLDTTPTYEVWKRWAQYKRPTSPDSTNYTSRILWDTGVRYTVSQVDVRCSDLATRMTKELLYDSVGNALGGVPENAYKLIPETGFAATFPESVGESIVKNICADIARRSLLPKPQQHIPQDGTIDNPRR